MKYGLDFLKVSFVNIPSLTEIIVKIGTWKAIPKPTIIFIAKKHVDLIGEPKYFESKGTSGSHVRRGFCPNCGSGILSYTKELPHILFVKAGTLDDSSWVKIDSNFFTKSANAWDSADESIKCFDGNPGLMSGLKMLLKSF